ncbi:hypothetical protein BDV96DRAFT_379556 [Lophiotrema nucula]|uniref:DUF6604 domain-containing protein n=1 Tax=Lophiotrema nucula TaxID=690887 RepID=A0A6A5ZG27_9PLEO|nr:hypothetical protein BDV96DRAFT_379556 [Lophiotrema nucula]
MLPEWVRTRRSRYKSDTRTFLTWLVEQAIRHGYTPATKPVQSDDSSSYNKSKKHKMDSASEQEERRIRSRDIVACATAIVEKKSNRFRVPAFILEAAARAIKERQMCTSWYKKQTPVDSSDAILVDNETHEHFTDKMQEAATLLTPFVHHSKPAEHSEKPRDPDPPSNAFQMLSIEEVIDEGVDKIPHQPPFNVEGASKVVTYTIEEEEQDECPVSIYFFLHDVWEIRTIIVSTWIIYFCNGADLLSTGITTQAGMQMIRAMIGQLVSEFPKLTSMEALVEQLLSVTTDDSGAAIGIEGLDNALKHMSVETKQFTCFQTYRDIESLLASKSSRGAFREGLNSLGPASIRQGKTKSAKLRLDKLMALKVFIGSIACLFDQPEHKSATFPVMDNFTQVWYEHLSRLPKARASRPMKPSSCSIELVVFTQIFLDLQVLLESKTDRILKEYNDFAKYFDLPEIVEWIRTLVNSSSRTKKHIHSFGKDSEVTEAYVAWLNDDPLVSCGVAHGKQIEQGSWIRLNPVLGSLILFTAAEGVFDLRLCHAKMFGSLISQAQLYNALRQMKRRTESGKRIPLLNREWEDMETFIDVFGEKGIFRGPRPDTLRKCMDRYNNVLGVSTSALRRHQELDTEATMVSHGEFVIETIPIIRAVFGNRGDKKNLLNILSGHVRSAFTKKVNSLGFSDDCEEYLDQMYLSTFRNLLSFELPKLYFRVHALALDCKTIQTALFEGLEWGFDNLQTPLYKGSTSSDNSSAFGDNAFVSHNILQHEFVAHSEDTDEAVSSIMINAGRIVTRELYKLHADRKSSNADFETKYWRAHGQ